MVQGVLLFFFQAEDGIRDYKVTGVQTCALPISGGLIRASMPPVAGSGVGTEGWQMLFRSPMIPLEPCAQNPIRPPMSPMPGTEQTPPEGAVTAAGAAACTRSPDCARAWTDAAAAGFAADCVAAWATAGRPSIAATAPATSSARRAGRTRRGPRAPARLCHRARQPAGATSPAGGACGGCEKIGNCRCCWDFWGDVGISGSPHLVGVAKSVTWVGGMWVPCQCAGPPADGWIGKTSPPKVGILRAGSPGDSVSGAPTPRRLVPPACSAGGAAWPASRAGRTAPDGSAMGGGSPGISSPCANSPRACLAMSPYPPCGPAPGGHGAVPVFACADGSGAGPAPACARAGPAPGWPGAGPAPDCSGAGSALCCASGAGARPAFAYTGA